jgi:hypothetical protein
MTTMMGPLPDAEYPRDMRGYGATPPHPRWPGGARVALQFVLNYEEGAENSVLHGDAASETFLSEIIGAAAFADRHLSMESLYEYGRARRRVACAAAVRGAPHAAHDIRGRDGARAQSRRGRCVRRGRARDREPRPALDQLPERRRGHRARAHRAGRRDDGAANR